MRNLLASFKTALGLALLVILAVPLANAQCFNLGKYKKSAFLLPPSFSARRWLRAAFAPAAYIQAQKTLGAQQDPIVGFWSVKWIAEGNTAASTGLPPDQVPPDGAVLGTGLQQWHSDGTEIHNAGNRPPVIQSFCLGMWKKVGPSEYQLNHFTISWNPDNTFLGPGNIREAVTLSKDHNSLSGTVTIDQYDAAGNLLVHLQGTLVGIRITLSTTIHDLL